MECDNTEIYVVHTIAHIAARLSSHGEEVPCIAEVDVMKTAIGYGVIERVNAHPSQVASDFIAFIISQQNLLLLTSRCCHAPLCSLVVQEVQV